MDDLDAYCATLKAQIKKQYEKSQHNRGWRFLYSPRRVLNGAEVAFLGLNPGVDRETRGFEPKSGSAFITERWDYRGKKCCPGQAPLQKQVCALFAKLGVQPEDVLAGNLVPFCTKHWKEVEKEDPNSIPFGESLWEDVFQRAQPRLVIGMGKDVLRPLRRIFKARIPQSVLVNWGNIRGHRVRLAGGGLLVVLPHLSRFSIIDRPESADALRDLFGEYWRG